MNEIINWMALNNTLMIRIGFTAVILLILAYVFRFFFVPKVSVVEVTETSSVGGAAAGVSVNIEELAELQAEIDTLKVKLKQSEVERTTLANVSKAAAGAGNVDMVATAAAPSAEEAAKKAKIDEEMNEKLRILEARLSEYEIIAEDIAEISKLRSENLELKAKLENLGTKQSFVEAEPEPEAAVEPVVEAVSEVVSEDVSEAVVEPETVLDDLLAAEAPAPDAPISQVVVESEIPVSDEEKSILDEFEKFQNSKKG